MFSAAKLRDKYSSLLTDCGPDAELHVFQISKGEKGNSLGVSLAGNVDRRRMSVFVVGVIPGGAAHRDGRINVGDELLEVGHAIPH